MSAEPKGRMDLPGCVYVCRDLNSVVIYVGAAREPMRRMTEHVWHRDVATVQLYWLPTRAEALALESTLIKEHQPKYNVQHNGDRHSKATKLGHAMRKRAEIGGAA